METSDISLPERKLAPQVHLLTDAADLGRRIRGESLGHYVHAVMRTIEEFLAPLPETRGMDFRAAVAILPGGQALVDVEFRPDLLTPAIVADIRQRIESLPRPPVREGPVAFLAFWLIRGGSNDLRDSFRQPLEPCFRMECPQRFAAAVNGAETASRPRPLPRWRILCRLMRRVAFSPPSREGGLKSTLLTREGGLKSTLLQKAGQFASRSRTVLRRAWSVLFSTAATVKSPSDVHQSPCNLRQGPCNFRAGQHTLDEITAQIRLCPHCGTLYARRAGIYGSQGEFDLAIADYTRQIELGTEVSLAHLARGVCYRMTGQQEKALEDFNEALWRRPRWAEALVMRAWTHQALGKSERVLADVNLAVELEPDEPNWLLARARRLAADGKFAEAIADTDRALGLDPHDGDALLLRASIYRDRPCAPEQVKADFEAAMADFTSVLYLHPGHAESYASRASIRMRLDDFAGALADCAKAIERDPKCVAAYFCRANIHFLENRLAQAMRDCNQTLRVAPGHVDALSARGMIRTQLGLYREALSDFNQAVRQAPESPLAYLHRGNAYGTLDDHQAALDDFSEAIRLDPGFTIAYYSRAVAWLHLGEHPRAIEDCDAAIGRDANCAPAYFLRARLLDELGVSDEAIASYNDAIRLAPDFAAAYAGRANAWIGAGDYDQAISDYRQAIHREPAAGQMLGQLDEEYAVEAVVRGLAEAEPGRGNLFLAGFLAHCHSLDEAFDQCEAAMEHLPPEEAIGVALQVLRERMDEAGPELFQRVEAWFQRAAAPQGKSARLDFLLAYFRDLQGRYDERCAIYRRLSEQADLPAAQRALACNNLAYFLAVNEEDVRGALDLADRAIELSGPYPEYLDTRGVALLAAGRLDEAMAELRRAVGNKPTGLRLYHLARACHAAGEAESAQEAWEEAHHEQELTLQEIPFYERHQYRATAEILQKYE